MDQFFGEVSAGVVFAGTMVVYASLIFSARELATDFRSRSGGEQLVRGLGVAYVGWLGIALTANAILAAGGTLAHPFAAYAYTAGMASIPALAIALGLRMRGRVAGTPEEIPQEASVQHVGAPSTTSPDTATSNATSNQNTGSSKLPFSDDPDSRHPRPIYAAAAGGAAALLVCCGLPALVGLVLKVSPLTGPDDHIVRGDGWYELEPSHAKELVAMAQLDRSASLTGWLSDHEYPWFAPLCFNVLTHESVMVHSQYGKITLLPDQYSVLESGVMSVKGHVWVFEERQRLIWVESDAFVLSVVDFPGRENSWSEAGWPYNSTAPYRPGCSWMDRALVGDAK